MTQVFSSNPIMQRRPLSDPIAAVIESFDDSRDSGEDSKIFPAFFNTRVAKHRRDMFPFEAFGWLNPL